MIETGSLAAANAAYVPDDRVEPYRMISGTLAHIAEKCGVAVDELTRRRWSDAGGLMREFDTFADELPLGDAVDPMIALRDFSLFAPRFSELTPEALGEEGFAEMVETVDTILQIGDDIATTTDPNEYIELRKAEAYYTSKAFADLATPFVKGQPGYTEFRWRTTGLGISANMGDSILDVWRDNKEGRVQIVPNWDLYKALAYDLAKHGRRHADYILDREGVTHRARMLGARAVNRARHLGNGIPEYSNLRLLIPRSKLVANAKTGPVERKSQAAPNSRRHVTARVASAILVTSWPLLINK